MSLIAARLRDLSSNAEEREKLFSAMLVGLFIAYGWLLVRAALEGVWIITPAGLPVAADFTAFWEAARLAMEGKAASAYDWTVFEQRLMDAIPVNADDAKFPFFYPPSFFLFIAPLGALPYLAAAIVWLGATLTAYLMMARLLWPDRKALLVALAAPAALWCICIGQNGLLTAALLGAALATLDRRPWIAGLLIGLLAYKPHFGVLIPLVLILSGRWQVFLSAALTACAMLLASLLLFGSDVLVAFFQAMQSGGDRLLAQGQLPWVKMQSVYGMVRSVGFGEIIAWGTHGLIAFGAALFTLRMWRSEVSFALKAAALSSATLVISPYSCIYDLPVLTVSVLFLMQHQHKQARAWETPLLFFAFMLPLLFPILNLPLGPLVYALIGIVIFLRVQDELGSTLKSGKWWVRWDSNPGQLD